MVPRLLDALAFRSNNAVHRPLIQALELLKRYAGSSQRLDPADEAVPLEGVVRPSIQELVVTTDAQGREWVDRINYEICVLQAVREQLRCKEIWVVGADRYRNPDQDLPQDFAERRESYSAEVQQSLDADLFIRTVRGGRARPPAGAGVLKASRQSATAGVDWDGSDEDARGRRPRWEGKIWCSSA